MIFGFAVTIHTPTHAQWSLLVNDIHRFNGPVTCLAGDFAADVPAMIESHEVWEHVHFFPLDDGVVLVGRSEFFNPRAIGLNDFVTVHADIERRNCGMNRFLGSHVAV